MSGFLQALPVVLEHEGGFVDHPDDPGGATNKGITQATYDAWRTEHDLETRSVREIEDKEVEAIYHQDYWIEAHCDEWPWPLPVAVFDAAVNYGPRTAIKLLQRAAGTTDDGIVGPNTRTAVEAQDADELLVRYLWERMEYYAKIVRNKPSQAAFIVGWVRRLRRLWNEAKV